MKLTWAAYGKFIDYNEFRKQVEKIERVRKMDFCKRLMAPDFQLKNMGWLKLKDNCRWSGRVEEEVRKTADFVREVVGILGEDGEELMLGLNMRSGEGEGKGGDGSNSALTMLTKKLEKKLETVETAKCQKQKDTGEFNLQLRELVQTLSKENQGLQKNLPIAGGWVSLESSNQNLTGKELRTQIGEELGKQIQTLTESVEGLQKSIADSTQKQLDLANPDAALDPNPMPTPNGDLLTSPNPKSTPSPRDQAPPSDPSLPKSNEPSILWTGHQTDKLGRKHPITFSNLTILETGLIIGSGFDHIAPFAVKGKLEKPKDPKKPPLLAFTKSYSSGSNTSLCKAALTGNKLKGTFNYGNNINFGDFTIQTDSLPWLDLEAKHNPLNKPHNPEEIPKLKGKMENQR